jgi:bifunctional aspartokinase / homoserine dehydrogenase 1
MKILKFGGSSVATPEKIRNVIQIILKQKDIAVVVSAFGGVTDTLHKLADLAAQGNEEYKTSLQELNQRHIDAVNDLIKVEHQTPTLNSIKKTLTELENILHGVFLVKELSPRILDLVLSIGEILSAYIISETLKQHTKAQFLDARKIIKTDSSFNNANVLFKETNENIQKYFQEKDTIQVITGFIASTEQDQTTTLGRGGSDYTASILASSLSAEEIQVWKDVDGVMTSDPRKVKKAFSIPTMTYQEAMELTHFGAKVIYPKTMKPAMDKNIPLRIKNTFNPDFAGTLVTNKQQENNYIIKGISSITDISLLRVQGPGMVGVAGISMRLFAALAKNSINVILISQASSEHSVCFAVKPESSKKAKQAIEKEFYLELNAGMIDEITVEENLSIIAVVGENMRKAVGVSGKLFRALGKNGINVVAIAQGSSELNISVVIPKHDEVKALNVVHDAFFLSGTKTLNLFLVGTGLIGGTLLKQILAQSSFLIENHAIDVKVAGIANSKNMLFNEDGISLECWEESLNASNSSDLDKFIKQMINFNLSNSVFVDCTASDLVIKNYETILKNSISVVTPNKKANSNTWDEYTKLKYLAKKHNIKFLYETNVGAGLPVIRTLQDLFYSGDHIIKIEAVLSGTLSYIFNTFKADTKFSTIVKSAQEQGFTEPDPRDDLNGLDVARKILILARESGIPLELKDIEVENLVPESCRETRDINQFFEELEKNDDYFEQKKQEAEKNNKVLRYIALLQDGKASISLQSVDSSHPFYSLDGSDNIISFTTQRYHERPLVIKGPGAGAEVTAAGVFADIISIANYLS